MRGTRCEDTEGKCFARSDGYCTILTATREQCKFKKPERGVTKGKFYPYINPATYEETKDD